MGLGGARKGAGRPKLEATKLRQALVAIAEKNAGKLAEVLFAKASTGDVPALRELFDRTLGKSKESVDLTSGGDKLVVTWLKPNEVQ